MKTVDVKINTKRPGIAMALTVTGVLIIILGIIVGFELGNVSSVDRFGSSHTEFSFAVAMLYWLSAFVLGMLCCGIGEIINLLTIIANKEYNITEGYAGGINNEKNTEKQNSNNKLLNFK